MASFKGRVATKTVSLGSKSEREAVLLETDDGDYVLRRRGGNPFRDRVLEALVGHQIAAKGRVRGKTLFLATWKDLEKPQAQPEQKQVEQEQAVAEEG